MITDQIFVIIYMHRVMSLPAELRNEIELERAEMGVSNSGIFQRNSGKSPSIHPKSEIREMSRTLSQLAWTVRLLLYKACRAPFNNAISEL